jgi:hypothetical protein
MLKLQLLKKKLKQLKILIKRRHLCEIDAEKEAYDLSEKR